MRDLDFKKGDKLKCHWADSYQLTIDRIYIALSDTVEGQFPNWPYIIVEDDEGKKVTLFASRFTKVEE